MLADLFKTVEDFFQRKAAVVPTVVKVNPSKRVITYWDPDTKTVVDVPLEREDTRHKFLSIDSLIEFVESSEATRTNVWVGTDLITVELDQHSSVDVETMELKYAPMFEFLTTLEKNPIVSQYDAIRILRQRLSAFDVGAQALTAVRSLKLTRQEETEIDQTHLASKVGKSIMQSASGLAELPEYIDVTTDVYNGAGDTPHKVRVWLSINFSQSGTLRFEPDESDMEDAILAERIAIVSRLKSALDHERVRVYEGVYSVVAG